MKVSGIAAIVTGGASGLGGAVAQLLADAGAKVTIFDLNEQLGATKAAQIKGHFIAVDVVDEVAVENALQQAHDINGAARVLVNCAGIGPPGKVIDRNGNPIPLSTFARIVNINLVGTFNVLSQFAARLHGVECGDEERGVVINTASVAAYDGQIGQAAYAASKGGVVGLTLPIARDLSQYGIRCCTIAPGIFETPMLMGLPDAARKALEASIPFPSRLGRPAEYAALACHIIENPMLNG